MADCRLCVNDRPLCRSHVLPEFLYGDLYNDRDQMMGVTGRGTKGWKPLQTGIWERLLCQGCEDFLNVNFEQLFRKQWFELSPLPSHMAPDEIFRATFDYASFKLFHMSVLFRASVAKNPTFRFVKLGIHEDRIRKMLLARDPGGASDYPLVGFVVLNSRNEVVTQLISCPVNSRYADHNTYGWIFGGAMWWYCISSHRNRDFEQLGLQTNGAIQLRALPWNDIGVVQSAKEALLRACP